MSVLEFLLEHNVPLRRAGESPHVSQEWLGVECPFCGAGTGKYGMGIPLAGGVASCWKCGKHRLAEVLRELTGEPWNVCHDIARSDPGAARPEGPFRGRLRVPEGLGDVCDRDGRLLPADDAGLLPPHLRYLRARGLVPDSLSGDWGVRGIGLSARLAWRLWIPAVHRGRVVSWTTRALSEEASPRYLSAKPGEEEVSLKSLLFGEDYCRHAAVVCEGPFDVFRIGKGAVATCGVSYTQAQVQKMAKYPLRVIVFDSGTAAQTRARRLCEELAVFPGRTERVELDAKDPGSATEKELRLLRRLYLE